MKSYSLIKNNNKTKAIFIGSLAALTLILQMGTINLSPDSDRESKYNEYSVTYLQTLKNIDYSEFDTQFEDIYKNGTYNINGENYSIDEVYIITLDDNKNHLIKAGENYLDILTKEEISGKKIKIACLKNTSVFYNLYQDGVIINPDIVLNTQTLKKYVDSWDGQFQDAIPELKASHIATEKMKQKN